MTWAVLVSYLVGSPAAAAVLVVTQAPMPRLATFGVKWYQWTGGALGMAYPAALTFSLQRVGAASLFALVVTGQLLTALCDDQFGLHTRAGFRAIGHRERIGQHHGVWRNTVQLERRSPTVGAA